MKPRCTTINRDVIIDIEPDDRFSDPEFSAKVVKWPQPEYSPQTEFYIKVPKIKQYINAIINTFAKLLIGILLIIVAVLFLIMVLIDLLMKQ